MVPLSSNRISRVPPYFSDATYSAQFRIQGFHFLRLTFPSHSPTDSIITHHRLLQFRSPLLPESRLISFPAGTKMFQFSAFASLYLSIQYRISYLRMRGSPIRISSAHSSFNSSPGLFAAYHVLLRLPLPRHSPIALIFLEHNKVQYLSVSCVFYFVVKYHMVEPVGIEPTASCVQSRRSPS